MVTNTDKLDKVDLLILRTLQENARLTTKELAARVNLSSTPRRAYLPFGKQRLYQEIHCRVGCGKTESRLHCLL